MFRSGSCNNREEKFESNLLECGFFIISSPAPNKTTNFRLTFGIEAPSSGQLLCCFYDFLIVSLDVCTEAREFSPLLGLLCA
jgi:hypothetical protein